MAKADLKDAVLGGQQEGGGDPFGGYPELDALYAPEMAAIGSNAVTKGAAYNDAVAVANAKAAQAAELQRKQQLVADLSDPNKYQQLPKEDGGYTFLSPNGKEISAFDYSRITGKSIDSILADSQNPIDIGFNKDWANLNDYLDAWYQGDKDKVKQFQDAQPELKSITDPQDIVNRFRQAYPTVFGQGGFAGKGTAGQPTGSTYIPYVPNQSGGAITPIGG